MRRGYILIFLNNRKNLDKWQKNGNIFTKTISVDFDFILFSNFLNIKMAARVV